MFSMERIEDHIRGVSYFVPVDKPVNNDDQVLDRNDRLCKVCANIEWTWLSPNDDGDEFVNLMNNDRDVRFHQRFSHGTAIVRGSQPMSDHQFYWEIKMTQPVYGTDIMVGVGTSEADISQVPDKFLSVLGMDNKTWGLSYTGLFYHSGESQEYSPSFGQGSTIGVHLDLWRGTLSFYKDKQHFGVASTGLRGKTLYAMASSTAARSGMRIMRCSSFPSSLQFLCCLKLRDIIPNNKNVLDVVEIPNNLRRYLDNNLDWLLDQCNCERLHPTNMCKHGNLKNNLMRKVTTKDASFYHVVHDQDSDESLDDSSSIMEDQFLLLGSVLPITVRNRFQAVRRRYSHLMGDESSNSAAKRLHYSYNYSVGLSDTDSDCD